MDSAQLQLSAICWLLQDVSGGQIEPLLAKLLEHHKDACTEG